MVLAIDDPEKTTKLVAHIHRRYPEVKIIARARDRHHVYELYAAGTPDSVREVFDSSVRAGKYALAALDYDEEEIEHIAEAFFEHDRHMLAELAELWDPEIPAGAQRRLHRQGARADRRYRGDPARRRLAQGSGRRVARSPPPRARRDQARPRARRASDQRWRRGRSGVSSVLACPTSSKLAASQPAPAVRPSACSRAR